MIEEQSKARDDAWAMAAASVSWRWCFDFPKRKRGQADCDFSTSHSVLNQRIVVAMKQRITFLLPENHRADKSAIHVRNDSLTFTHTSDAAEEWRLTLGWSELPIEVSLSSDLFNETFSPSRNRSGTSSQNAMSSGFDGSLQQPTHSNRRLQRGFPLVYMPFSRQGQQRLSWWNLALVLV